MALHIIDLDGTIFQHGTDIPLKGALDLLETLVKREDQIIFVTRRGDKEFADRPNYNRTSAIQALAKIGYGDYPLITDVSSPRIIINDDGCAAYKRVTNAEWTSVDRTDYLMTVQLAERDS